jgi:hypothetical protein
MIRLPDPHLQENQRRAHMKRRQASKRLLRKIRMGLWSQAELEWLLAHLGELLTPDIAAEIRHKLQALTEKGVD